MFSVKISTVYFKLNIQLIIPTFTSPRLRLRSRHLLRVIIYAYVSAWKRRDSKTYFSLLKCKLTVSLYLFKSYRPNMEVGRFSEVIVNWEVKLCLLSHLFISSTTMNSFATILKHMTRTLGHSFRCGWLHNMYDDKQ